MQVRPVILSGGAGTRLWPVSRQQKPKQLIALTHESQTMLQQTLGRFGDVDRFGAPIIIGGEDHRFLIAEQARAAGTSADIILEPMGRNTAPALALAALHVAAGGGDDLALVVPSDHVVKDVAAFHAAIETAAKAAQTGAIVTFGIAPDAPETGFGYIEMGEALPGVPGAHGIAQFKEKPDAVTAQQYLETGRYAWNAGMFLFRPGDCLAAFETLAPDVLAQARKALDGGAKDTDFVRLDADHFAAAPNISFDYAIMEKAQSTAVVPCDIGWSDVGSFAGLRDVLEMDASGTAHVGKVEQAGCAGSLLYSTGPAIAAYGLKDIILVATDDVVLALPMGEAQAVKQLVDRFKAKNDPAAVRFPDGD